MRKLIHLQWMRAIAASLVVIDHATGVMVTNGDLPHSYDFPRWILGWIGVAVFFAISGLIMMRQSANRFGAAESSFKFMYLRIIRIVPMYWLAITTNLILFFRHHVISFVYLTKSMLFIPYAEPGQSVIRPILGQGWTLDYEMFFYVIFAFALAFRRRLGVALVALVFLTLMVVGAVFKPLAPYTDPVTPFAFYTDPMIVLFLAGALIGYSEIRIPEWYRIRFSFSAAMLFVLAPIVFFWCVGGSFPLQISLQAPFMLCAVAAVLLCTTANDAQFGRLGKVLELAGDSSYSTYLFHTFLLVALQRLYSLAPAHIISPWVYVAVAVILANAMGYIIHIVVETPLIAALRRVSFAKPKAILAA